MDPIVCFIMSPFRFVGFPGSFFSPSFRVTAHPVLPFFLWGCFKPAGNISIASVSAIHRIVLICVITRCFYGGFVSDGKSVLGGFFRTLQAACSFYCVISAGSVFRTGTFLDNLESFAGTILFCQICPLTVRPSPMPDETEQPDRKTACSADLRFRFLSKSISAVIATRSGSPTCAAGAAGTDVVGRARLSRSMRRSICRVSGRFI